MYGVVVIMVWSLYLNVKQPNLKFPDKFHILFINKLKVSKTLTPKKRFIFNQNSVIVDEGEDKGFFTCLKIFFNSRAL